MARRNFASACRRNYELAHSSKPASFIFYSGNMLDAESRWHMCSLIEAHVPANSIEDCEHALYCWTQGRKANYRLASVRLMEIISRPDWQARIAADVEEYGRFDFFRLFSASPTDLFHGVPAQAALSEQQTRLAAGHELLRSMASTDDQSHVPDAGIRCTRCSSSDIAFEFLQTRAADEGTTVYCTCTSCQKRWRMN